MSSRKEHPNPIIEQLNLLLDKRIQLREAQAVLDSGVHYDLLSKASSDAKPFIFFHWLDVRDGSNQAELNITTIWVEVVKLLSELFHLNFSTSNPDEISQVINKMFPDQPQLNDLIFSHTMLLDIVRQQFSDGQLSPERFEKFIANAVSDMAEQLRAYFNQNMLDDEQNDHKNQATEFVMWYLAIRHALGMLGQKPELFQQLSRVLESTVWMYSNPWQVTASEQYELERVLEAATTVFQSEFPQLETDESVTAVMTIVLRYARAVVENHPNTLADIHLVAEAVVKILNFVFYFLTKIDKTSPDFNELVQTVFDKTNSALAVITKRLSSGGSNGVSQLHEALKQNSSFDATLSRLLGLVLTKNTSVRMVGTATFTQP